MGWPHRQVSITHAWPIGAEAVAPTPRPPASILPPARSALLGPATITPVERPSSSSGAPARKHGRRRGGRTAPEAPADPGGAHDANRSAARSCCTHRLRCPGSPFARPRRRCQAKVWTLEKRRSGRSRPPPASAETLAPRPQPTREHRPALHQLCSALPPAGAPGHCGGHAAPPRLRPPRQIGRRLLRTLAGDAFSLGESREALNIYRFISALYVQRCAHLCSSHEPRFLIY